MDLRDDSASKNKWLGFVRAHSNLWEGTNCSISSKNWKKAKNWKRKQILENCFQIIKCEIFEICSKCENERKIQTGHKI